MINQCPFCDSTEKGKEVLQRQRLFEEKYWNILIDHKPSTRGHLILTPKRHCTVAKDLNKEEWSELQRIIGVCQGVFESFGKKGGHFVYWKYGENAGQHIEHLVIHLIPSQSMSDLVCIQIKLLFGTCFDWLRPRMSDTDMEAIKVALKTRFV